MNRIRRSLRNSLEQVLLQTLHEHIDAIIDQNVVVVINKGVVSLVPDKGWRWEPSTYAYFVGLLTVVRVNSSGYASCWMENAGTFGFISAKPVASSMSRMDIVQALGTDKLPTSFQHPLGVPQELWRLPTVDAAEAAIQAYLDSVAATD